MSTGIHRIREQQARPRTANEARIERPTGPRRAHTMVSVSADTMVQQFLSTYRRHGAGGLGGEGDSAGDLRSLQVSEQTLVRGPPTRSRSPNRADSRPRTPDAPPADRTCAPAAAAVPLVTMDTHATDGDDLVKHIDTRDSTALSQGVVTGGRVSAQAPRMSRSIRSTTASRLQVASMRTSSTNSSGCHPWYHCAICSGVNS